MSRKSKGINAERELIHLFWSRGWAAIRVAGSGSIGYPCPDVLAGNSLRKLAIESKASKDKKRYLTKKQVCELKEFCHLFGAEPWIAIRYDNVGWYFISPEDLRETGNNFAITEEITRNKGLLFEELIK